MRIEKVALLKASMTGCVMDCYVGKGLKEGGHSALPDIDVDFASDRRQEIKEYLERRYNVNGLQRVFSAGTFTSLKLKAVIKDVCRVYRIPVSSVNYITAIISSEQTWTDLFMLAAKNKKVNRFIQEHPDVFEDIRTIMGQPRSASIHASAIIVTPEYRDGEIMECFDFLPIRKNEGLLVSEFDGYSVDEIGLLKEDVLATKELSKLGAILQIVNRVYDKDYSIERIIRDEINDLKTYRLLSSGSTQNIFQFSSKGITKFIMDVQPNCIEDLIAINALYRPATLEINATEDYIRYKSGDVAPVYNFGTYDATKNTYGIMTYQEQFMQIAHTLGGFDLGKTDYLRKAIGKKNPELMASLKEDFIAGAIANGCPDYEAEEIWHKIEVAGKYSFNRSHAAAYALTAYTGAWLKANFPTAFYTIALQWADDRELPMIMHEMEESNARIVPPDINVSSTEFFTNYETDEIFWSLTRIKMLGVKAVEYIVDERTKNGSYSSVENFIHRIFKHKLRKYQYWDDPEEDMVRVPVNARQVKHLILAGAFDKVSGIKAITERFSILQTAAHELGFTLTAKDIPLDLTDKHYFWSMQQIDISGIGHIDYKRIYDNSNLKTMVKCRISYMPLSEVMNPENEGKKVVVCGIVMDLNEVSYKDKNTDEKKRFCKVLLQQNNCSAELVLWSDSYAAFKNEIIVSKNKVIIVTALIRYSDYTGGNCLNSFKSSRIEII